MLYIHTSVYIYIYIYTHVYIDVDNPKADGPGETPVQAQAGFRAGLDSTGAETARRHTTDPQAGIYKYICICVCIRMYMIFI